MTTTTTTDQLEGFDLYEGDYRYGRDGLPRLTLRHNGTMSLNADAYRALGRPERVRLGYHPDKRIIALLAVPPSESTAARVIVSSSGRGEIYSLSAAGFCRRHGLAPAAATRYVATQRAPDLLMIDMTQAGEPASRSPHLARHRATSPDGTRDHA